MAYSVKYSTTNAQENLTPLDRALRSIESMESLTTINKITRNITKNPDEKKFRRLRLTNAKIAALLVEVPGCLDALGEMGWARSEEDADFLEIAGKLGFDKVRAIESAFDHRTKEDDKNQQRRVAARAKKAAQEEKRQ